MENNRILEVYKKREMKAKKKEGFFTYESLAHLYRIHERYRATLFLLKLRGFHPLSDLKILDVGCGYGDMLRQFLQWGAKPENLAGIELRQNPVNYALSLNPNLDIRCGSAIEVPWPEKSFDIVCQHTVFTSILDPALKLRIAAEIKRVLVDGGAVLWYDFMFDNPSNSDVRGISAKEIRSLFGDLEIELHRITLAPPIARRIPIKLLPIVYPLIALIPYLRTHYLGLFVKRSI